LFNNAKRCARAIVLQAVWSTATKNIQKHDGEADLRAEPVPTRAKPSTGEIGCLAVSERSEKHSKT
jgi:hypothetical protein